MILVDDERIRAASLSIASNSLLVVMKIAVGLWIGSVSIISEAIHSGIDLIASCMDFIAVKASSRPPDARHNFGHGKIENVAGTLEALLILGAAILIVKESVERIMGGGEILDVGWGIALMGYSVVQNFAVSQYMLGVAKRTSSIAVEADAMHLRTDVYTSLGVFVGLILLQLTGLKILDPVCAIIVALIIAKASFELTKKAFVPLVDTALSPEEIDSIHRVLEEYKDAFIEYHELRTRRSGRDRHVDLHLVTCPEMSVKNVHDLCDDIEARICSEIPNCHVLIHVEPYEGQGGCEGS